VSRLRVPPSVYGVAWDADRIVKIGFSEYQRWRHFIGRGGRVIFVRQFAEFHSAITAEGVCHDLLRSLSFACPFRSAIDAEPYMGRGGGGWRECYAMTAEDALRAMDAVCPTALGAHAPSMCSEHVLRACGWQVL